MSTQDLCATEGSVYPPDNDTEYIFILTRPYHGIDQHQYLQNPSIYSWPSKKSSNKQYVHNDFGAKSRRISTAVSKKVLALYSNLEGTRSRERLEVNNSFSHGILSESVLVEIILPIRYEFNHLTSDISHAVQGGDDLLASNLRRRMDNVLTHSENVLLSLGIDEAKIQSKRNLIFSSNKVFCVKQSQPKKKKEKRRRKRKKKKSKFSVFLL